MNWMKKIIFCKCPHCKEHGIPFREKMRIHGYEKICRKCGKTFDDCLRTYLVTVAFGVGGLFFWNVLDKLNIVYPEELRWLINGIAVYLMIYILPLKEKKNKIKPVAMEREDEENTTDG